MADPWGCWEPEIEDDDGDDFSECEWEPESAGGTRVDPRSHTATASIVRPSEVTGGAGSSPRAAVEHASACCDADGTAAAVRAPPHQANAAYAAGHFLHEKAGMQGIDKAHVARVVEEASKGSKYYENAQAREVALTAKIAALKLRLAKFSAAEMKGFAAAMESFVAKTEGERALTNVCVCCDMDQFFAAVAMRDEPSLRGVPFAVGGIGMISTASYEARKYGVRSAMPGFIGLKLCPSLAFVRSDFAAYEKAAEETRAVFKLYDEHFVAGSLDEAFLDFTSYCHSTGVLQSQRTPISPAEVDAIHAAVQAMRTRITAETRGLTCSAGIAANHMLAKMASNERKPDGQFMIPFSREGVLAYLRDQPVRKIPGVGRVTERTLTELGIHTCNDILERKAVLRAAFTERTAQFLLRSALGIGAAIGWGSAAEDEDAGVGRKSISQERTFHDCSDWNFIRDKCSDLATSVSKSMKEEMILGRTVTIKVKSHTFEVRQRAGTLAKPSNDANVILECALRLLRAEGPLKLRLLGVRLSGLQKERTEPTLLDKFVRPADPDVVLVQSQLPAEDGGREQRPQQSAKRRRIDHFFAEAKPVQHAHQECIYVDDDEGGADVASDDSQATEASTKAAGGNGTNVIVIDSSQTAPT